MCYSALVNQNAKNLGLVYKARIQIDVFEDLFKHRLAGSKAKIPRALEATFLESPKTTNELRIAKYIREFHALEMKELKEELEKQSKRLSAAEKALSGKVSKKAQNDQRVSTAKIEKLNFKIQRLRSGEISESDSRIWPGQYAPLIVRVNDERFIEPFRYHLRPMGQSPEFDRKFDGNYNARRDRLSEVYWWKSVFGKNHGLLPIKAFYENVALSKTRMLTKGEVDSNLVLRFEPEDRHEMLVPCLYDSNDEDDFPLESFALITDDPNPEVAAAGHDRTPIIIRETDLDAWLTPENTLESYHSILRDKRPTYFEHEVAA